MYAGGVVAWDNIDDYQQRYGEQQTTAPFAPIHSYDGGFDELGGLIRLVASRIVDVRDPIQIATTAEATGIVKAADAHRSTQVRQYGPGRQRAGPRNG